MSPRILVVDDERATNTLTSDYLRLAGYEVLQCFDGESALALLKSDRAFDLVVLDKRMPGIGGLAALKSLKADPRTSHIPVILLSASDNPRSAEASAGAAALMAKPFSPKDLISAIRKILPPPSKGQ